MQCRRSRSDPLMMPRNHLGFAPRLISPPPPTVAVTHLFSPSTYTTHLTTSQSTCFQNRSDLDCFQFDFGEKRRACKNIRPAGTSQCIQPVYHHFALRPSNLLHRLPSIGDVQHKLYLLRFNWVGFSLQNRSNNVIKVNPAIYKVLWNLLWMDWTHYE